MEFLSIRESDEREIVRFLGELGTLIGSTMVAVSVGNSGEKQLYIIDFT